MEKTVKDWKEIKYEVIRDCRDNRTVVTISNVNIGKLSKMTTFVLILSHLLKGSDQDHASWLIL